MPESDEHKLFHGMYKPNELMTSKDVEAVLKYGFRPTTCPSPSQLENSNWTWENPEPTPPPITPKTQYLGFCVTCNEDEVIEFLVQNNIPFSGSTHYGHQSVFYRRSDKTLLWIDNPGVKFEMYGHGDRAWSNFILRREKNYKPIRRESIRRYKRRRA